MGDGSMFGAWLRRLRQGHGLTQDDLAEQVGCATQTIRKIEGGQRRPSFQMAERLAQVLQLATAERDAWMRAAREFEPFPTAPAASPAHPLPLPLALPAYLTPFVGRERERASLSGLLVAPDCRLITLVGPGGVGKTRLAVEAARGARGISDGVAFVSLASVSGSDAVVTAVGDALGCSFAGPGDLVAQLLAALADRSALIVLDNLEHLLDAAGRTIGLLAQILAHAPGVRLLVTSRARLRLAGEWVIELDGLAAPPAGAGPGDYPALTLFLEHARRASQGFQPDAAGLQAIAQICRLVGGMPLAIELAAAWVPILSPAEIAAELARDLDALRLEQGAAPARHHSLRAVVDHSWRLLDADEQAALRALAVFQGGFSREAAARVAGAGLPILAALADKSLLRRATGGRYELHELIRQYAAERLAAEQVALTAAHERHAAYYADWCASRETALKSASMAITLTELGAEIDNLRAAWAWSVEHGRLDDLGRAAETAHWFYEFRGWYQEGAAAFGRAALALRPPDLATLSNEHRRTLGRLLAHHGYLASRLGALDQAGASLAQSLALLGDADATDRAHALMYQGMVVFQQGDFARARGDLEVALALGRANGDAWTTAFCEAWGSMVAQAVGDLEGAAALMRSALATYRTLGNPRCIVFCITFCSLNLIAREEYREAQELLRESLMLSQPTNDLWGMALALHHLGLVALHQRDAEEAAYLFREALALLRLTGNRWEVARALNDLGAALLELGDTDGGGQAYGEALATALAVRATPDALRAAMGLAVCHQRKGRPAAALALATRVVADPAVRSETRQRAEELVAATRPLLAPAEVSAATARAATICLNELLEEAVGR